MMRNKFYNPLKGFPATGTIMTKQIVPNPHQLLEERPLRTEGRVLDASVTKWFDNQPMVMACTIYGNNLNNILVDGQMKKKPVYRCDNQK